MDIWLFLVWFITNNDVMNFFYIYVWLHICDYLDDVHILQWN